MTNTPPPPPQDSEIGCFISKVVVDANPILYITD